MIYSKLRLVWVSVLLILSMVFCLHGCNRNGVPESGSQNNVGKSNALAEGMEDFDLEGLSLEEFFQPLEQGTYYLGTCESVVSGDTFRREFVFSLEDVQKKSFAATLFDVTDGQKATTKPEPLKGIIRARKFVVTHNGEEMTMRKIKLTKTGSGIQGSFTVGKRPYVFSLKRLVQPDYRVFEKRYERELYTYKILKNVKYGEAMGYWTSNVADEINYLEIFAKGVSSTVRKRNLDLLMDVYLPENDDIQSRPLIVFFHGGAFYIGDKADNPIVLWCRHFAACGYVVASINYRMGFQLTKVAIERCGYAAVQDAHAAMRYLLSKKDEYHINPDYVFVAGSSAGAITSLNLAFMRNATRPASSHKHGVYSEMGDIESSGNSLKQDFHIRAVANMWGAVNDLAQLSSSETSIVCFHGDADKVVPYDSGIPFYDMKVKIGTLFFGRMYGSAAIHRRAKQLGYRTELHTFHGAGHAPHVDKNNQPTPEFYRIQKNITDFFYGEFVPPATAVKRELNRPQWFRLDGDGWKAVHWKAEGGFILQTEKERVRVVFVEGKTPTLRASVLYENGASSIFHADL